MSDKGSSKSKEIQPRETEVVIAGYVRSPFTPASKGELKDVRADEILAQTIQGLLERTGVKPELIEDLKLGTAFPEGEQGLNMARNVVFMTDLPISVPGVTTNRFCGSSMETIHAAAGDIMLGKADAVIAAGVESMSRIPMGGFNPSPNPDLYENFPDAYISMGETAEVVAEKYNISRDEQEELAIASHKKSSKAQKEGLFREEIINITKKDGSVVSKDGCIREGTDKAALSKLKTAFKAVNGTVTAGTASPLTDGASAVLVTSRAFAEKHSLPILGKIVAAASTGLEPNEMGMGPVSATKKALEKAGLTMDDIDIVEINEAFGSQSVASLNELNIPMSKVNKDGGAISMGHPLGASGARITGKAASIAKREGKRYSLSTMCIGGGQGIATIMENLDFSNDNTAKLNVAAAKDKKTEQPNNKGKRPFFRRGMFFKK